MVRVRVTAKTSRRRRKNNTGKVTRPVVRAIVKSQLERAIENKMAFQNQPNTTIDDTLYVASATANLAQGTAANQRIGDSVRSKKLSIRMNMKMNSASVETSIRFVVWIGLAPEVTYNSGLLFFYNGIPGYEITSPINWPESSGRFRILFDKVFTLSAANNPSINYRKSFMLRNLTKWDRAANTARGQVYYGFISDESVNTPTIDFAHLYQYEDA